MSESDPEPEPERVHIDLSHMKKPLHVLSLDAIEFAANCLWQYREPNDDDQLFTKVVNLKSAGDTIETMLTLLTASHMSQHKQRSVIDRLQELIEKIVSFQGELEHPLTLKHLVDARLCLEAELEPENLPGAPEPAQS